MNLLSFYHGLSKGYYRHSVLLASHRFPEEPHVKRMQPPQTTASLTLSETYVYQQ